MSQIYNIFFINMTVFGFELLKILKGLKKILTYVIRAGTRALAYTS